jgi:hypothetical protein
MKNLISRAEIRWWFRSRPSNCLNALSYWLCVLLFSVLLSLIFSALWRVHVAEQSRLQRASEDSDWLGDAPLNALDTHRKTFLEKREDLINRVRYGDQSQGTEDAPLRPATNIRNRDGNLPAPGSMFGNPDIRVYPSFVTFSPKGKGREQLTDAEKAVFSNFAKFVTSLYESQKYKDPSHIEQSLAAALGLSDPSVGTAPLDVPWIYVASKEGAIAVFPGTTVIDESSWDTTSRPWFRAALGGDSQLFTKGLLEEDLLTVTYLDVLAKRPMQVRTYMYKFNFAVENTAGGVKNPAQEFVICIDIFRDRKLAGVTPSSAGMAVDEDATFVKTLMLPEHFGLIHYVTFGLSVLFFIALRWVSTTQNSKLTFTRAKGLVGKINVEDGLRTQNDELMIKENKIGIDVGKYGLGRAERSKQDKNNIMVHTSVEKSRTDLRGCELWEVSQNISETWSIFGIRFESVRTTHIGTIRLIYTSEVLPEADWRFFNHLAFSETEAANLRTKLPKLLERNADLCEGSLSISDQSDAPILLRAPDMPDWVRSVVNAKELLAVRQRRAYVRLDSERLSELYSKADVKAIMTSGYFEELLNHGHVDFLLKGKTISRIIALPDATAEFNLSNEAWKVLADLMGSYLPASARRLQRVGAPISNQSEPSPVYDFAILDDSCVIVAHFISKATGIDGASGKHTKSTYVVEGYISWRPADIEFYRGLFAQLAGQAKALTLPANKVEIIDEQLGSFEIEPNSLSGENLLSQ